LIGRKSRCLFVSISFAMKCSPADEAPTRLERRRTRQGPWPELGYRIVHQQGSHIVLETEQPCHQRLAVPAHKSLRVGTLSAILRAVGAHKGIERTELLRFL
jgi:predicted RNA binding protein YcfA (HicA-like mRNA interferase family)